MPRAPVSQADMTRLLAGHGGLFSARLGIDLSAAHPDELFKWFLASMLYGARIRESAAESTYREFVRRGLTTPRAILDASHEELLEVMGAGGYARYDGITSRKVRLAAASLLDEYGGDLNRLHESASNSADLERRLQQFWGVGPATTVIFLRELRGIWPKAVPPAGSLAALAAAHLRIGDAEKFWSRHSVRGYDFRHFEAALTRLGKDYCRRRRCLRSPIPHSPP